MENLSSSGIEIMQNTKKNKEENRSYPQPQRYRKKKFRLCILYMCILFILLYVFGCMLHILQSCGSWLLFFFF